MYILYKYNLISFPLKTKMHTKLNGMKASLQGVVYFL